MTRRRSGALAALSEALVEDEKYKDTYISYLSGTSHGAIIAALVGAGATRAEIADPSSFELRSSPGSPRILR